MSAGLCARKKRNGGSVSKESDKQVRDMLRKDIRGPNILPPLDRFHVKHTGREPSPADLLEAYFKQMIEIRNR
jgi:hypothetical protein